MTDDDQGIVRRQVRAILSELEGRYRLGCDAGAAKEVLAHLTNSDGHGFVLCTDGGMLSNYPIDLFDRAESPSARGGRQKPRGTLTEVGGRHHVSH